MKLILFGATGMVGAGTLREAIADPEVESVLCVGRSPCGVSHPKVRELVVPDLFDLSGVEDQLVGHDACIWAIGVSSMGLDEAAYARLTVELTLLWARALLRLNPGLSFCYCSGAGAGGSAMWARVRQRVEGELREMPFGHVGVVRPAFIRPAPGTRSRTWQTRVAMIVGWPLFLLGPLLPSAFTTAERLGRAMLRVVKGQAERYILESVDINRIGA
ncbi:MAG: hypothetical protein H6710_12805 [Myxococcales bacterium]|nr:hypothetical protein [Myxococcales bacterium]MCB9705294.1 hypothetical protein [Myxococcales bacterium]